MTAEPNGTWTTRARRVMGLGGVSALKSWAEDNPTEFYKLWGRLIPVEVSGEDGGAVSLTIRVAHE